MLGFVKRILVFLGLSLALFFGTAAPAQADVDDFSFSSFDATYELSADAEGHSVLRTTETLVAQFPDYDQNRGIRRELVESYDGHPTDLELESVTDETGASREYETESDDGFLVVTIAGDDYVYGEQTYVLTYVQHNVILYADGVEDFYWDTNGTGWAQPFGSVTANVVIDPALLPSLTGDVDSAYGTEGADYGNADTVETEQGYTFGVANVGAYENLTFAIGFQQGTFTSRASGFFDAPWPTLSAIGFLLVILGFIRAVVMRMTVLRDAPGRGTIIPEYSAPKGVALPISAVIRGAKAKTTPAEIIYLAVNGNIRLRESTKKRKPTYDLEFVTFDGADDYGNDYLRALFGSKPNPGKTRSLAKPDQKVSKRITTILTAATRDATARGYRRKPASGSYILGGFLATVGTITAVLFAIFALDNDYGGGIPLLFLIGSVLLAVITTVLVAKLPLTETGVDLRDYLAGLKVYIDLAEEDRLRYLQSPEGAEKLPVDTADRVAVVKLNEKLLPYAVLFGNEKRWAEELGKYYEETGSQPEWYSGSTAFNVAYFSTAIGSISTSASSSYSSSSSGSSGGSSSGGGGGGGGGGGV
jgi:uncharacterized membrane protein YgcG